MHFTEISLLLEIKLQKRLTSLTINSINLHRAIDFAVLVSEGVNSVLIGLNISPGLKKRISLEILKT